MRNSDQRAECEQQDKLSNKVTSVRTQNEEPTGDKLLLD